MKNFDEQIAEVFDKNPEIEHVYTTSDGNIFLPNAKDHARYHAQNYGLKLSEVKRVQNTSDTEKAAKEAAEQTAKEDAEKAAKEAAEQAAKEAAEQTAKEDAEKAAKDNNQTEADVSVVKNGATDEAASANGASSSVMVEDGSKAPNDSKEGKTGAEQSAPAPAENSKKTSTRKKK